MNRSCVFFIETKAALPHFIWQLWAVTHHVRLDGFLLEYANAVANLMLQALKCFAPRATALTSWITMGGLPCSMPILMPNRSVYYPCFRGNS
jgi:hypothetical protein